MVSQDSTINGGSMNNNSSMNTNSSMYNNSSMNTNSTQDAYGQGSGQMGTEVSEAWYNEADRGGTPDQITERRLSHLSKKLNLTPDQTNRIKPLILQNVTENQKMREERKGKQAGAMGMGMDSTSNNRYAQMDSSIRTILTPEQQTKFDAMHAKAQERMEQRMDDRKDKKMPRQ